MLTEYEKKAMADLRWKCKRCERDLRDTYFLTRNSIPACVCPDRNEQFVDIFCAKILPNFVTE